MSNFVPYNFHGDIEGALNAGRADGRRGRAAKRALQFNQSPQPAVGVGDPLGVGEDPADVFLTG